MAANGVNSNDSEIAECDGENVVTMMDVLQEQQDFEDDANAVLGASDDKNCTYSKGYVKRQAIYACLTCTDARNDETKRAGVCLACSLNCHENHDLVELYTKRNFRCDCGNPKFNSHPCQFTPNKNDLNDGNRYNHNFAGMYCVCQRPYPDPDALEEDEMIQCIICEDWLHSAHLESSIPPADQYTEMVCKGCMEKNEFLHDYSDIAIVMENVDVDVLSVNPEPSIVSVTTITNEKELFNDNKGLEVNSQNTDVEMSNDNLEVSDEKVLQDIEAVLENNTSDEQIASKDVEKSETGIAVDNGAMEQDSNEKSKLLENEEESEINDEGNKTESEVNTKNGLEHDLSTSKDVENSDTKAPLAGVAVDNGDITMELDPHENSKLLENEEESLINDEENKAEPEDNIKNDLEHDLSSQGDNTNTTEVEVNENAPTDLGSSSDLNDSNEDRQNRNEIDQITVDTTDKTGQETVPVETDKSGHKNESELMDKEKSDLESNKELNGIEESNKKEIEQVVDDIPLKTDLDTEVNELNNIVTKEIEYIDKDKTEQETNDEFNKINESQDIGLQEEIKQVDEDETNTDNNKINESNDSGLKEYNKQADKVVPDKTYNLETNEEINITAAQQSNDTSVNDKEMVTVERSNIDTEQTSPHIEICQNGNYSNGKNENDLKRKSEENEPDAKKPKLDMSPRREGGCTRPIKTKKTLKGSTFWPSNFRQKLCTCNECITMYKDLSVLFLIDPEDTVTAYEMLGQEKTPSSQYERGLEALSSLDRVQQINALTEYNKMRDKLLDFLKSFKDRKEIVKEEDIKAFFAGMKPKREPDGVYFCR